MRSGLLLLAGFTAAFAQTHFDAASVKPGGPFVSGGAVQMHGGPGTSDPGRIVYSQTRLKAIVQKAWGLNSGEVLGPAWLVDFADANSFTITATMPPGTTKEQLQLMLQNLLAERFHLVTHREIRGFPGYELVVAPGGPKLKAASSDKSDKHENSAEDNQHPLIGTWGMIRSSHRESMAQLAASLGAMVMESNGEQLGTTKSRVVDKTGLTGVYEFNLEFTGIDIFPASLMSAMAAPGTGPATAVPVAPEPGEAGPTIFTALEKQLGLKLQKVKNVPVSVLIVDHIDKVPTPD